MERNGSSGAPMRITAVTTIRDEGPFILEWVAYHRLIGVSDFFVYSNHCTDGSDALLDALTRRGWLRHLANPAKGRAYQMQALRDAARREDLRRADWIWIADVDEFLNIQVAGHTFHDLIAACQEPQAISIIYQYFANSGIERFEDRPIIGQFTRTHNPDLWGASPAIEVKTLIRRDRKSVV